MRYSPARCRVLHYAPKMREPQNPTQPMTSKLLSFSAVALTASTVLAQSDYVGPATVAIVHGVLGDRDAAIAALEQAYEERDKLLIHAENYGFFDPLRSDPRFRTPSGRGVAGNQENLTES